jgi:hypothetical protein
MTDFFREVDEDYRRDQVIELWKRYQNWIIGAAILVVLGTAAWRINVYFRSKADAAAGARYEKALQLMRNGKSADAIADFDALGKDGPRGYVALARLMSADQTARQSPEAGIKAYDALVADPVLNPRLKSVARLRAALLRVDRDSPKDFQQRYLAFAGPGEPYADSFRELLALSALKGGDETQAGQWLDEIVTDPAAPQSLRQRTDAFLALVQAGKLPNK